jgi:hypothetical protein
VLTVQKIEGQWFLRTMRIENYDPATGKVANRLYLDITGVPETAPPTPCPPGPPPSSSAQAISSPPSPPGWPSDCPPGWPRSSPEAATSPSLWPCC